MKTQDKYQYIKFDNKLTNIVKGIAVLFLLWHHLFYNNPENFDNYISIYKFSGGVQIEAYLSVFCKVCVAIFVFLSGYGLFFSYKKSQSNCCRDDIIFISTRLIKLVSSYWYIFIIFVPLGFAFGRNPIVIYDGSVLLFIVDFLGLSDLLFGSNTYTMNATWWYMSLAIILYLISPVVLRMSKKFSLVLLTVAFGLIFLNISFDHAQIRIYLLPFVLGIIFARYDLLNKIGKISEANPLLFGCASLILLFITFLVRQILLFENNRFDGIICIPVILVGYLVISKMKIIRIFFEHLGNHSGAIFMSHTFIYLYYFKDFIYSFKYSILIFLALTIICYLVAMTLELIKKIIRYDKFFNIIINKINDLEIRKSV